MAKEKHLLHLVHHLLIAFILLLKGYEKFSHHPFIGSLIFAFGVIIVLYFFYVVSAKKESSRLSLIVHLFEAFALLFTSYIFFADGKRYLPYFTLAASIGFFITVLVSIKKLRKQAPVKNEESIFSYGTLQKDDIQKKVFGRLLSGNLDILTGFKLLPIEIMDEAFLLGNENKMQLTLVKTGKEDDQVTGTVFRISKDELLRADEYEPENYERMQVMLRSGTVAWIYCAKTLGNE